ncbi:MAG: hypothetical protein E6165_06660, partial [Varibaculum cambriense]|nr:hypothetical protein [Varibaculum cambriense]
MTNEQGAKWLLQEMYDEGYRDIKIIGVYAYFVNPTFIENGGHFKVREHTPRIPCKVLGLGAGKKEYSIANILGIVEWEKVPVDTPILIKGTFEILKRYFAKYENGYVYFYSDGRTS